MLKEFTRQIVPPIMWNALRYARRRHISPMVQEPVSTALPSCSVKEQDLELYWDADFAEVLDTWGIGNVWDEIQFLMAGCSGKVLDVACGTGKTMEMLQPYTNVEVYGCDISDFLIQKAVERGISEERLRVVDATEMEYRADAFDYAYTIGSLEHFTEEGIDQCVRECHRVASKGSFHQMPVSRRNVNEGWMKTAQSFYNNSVEWWLNMFSAVYDDVHVVDSQWQDDISVGKWFLCQKGNMKSADGGGV